ncbi:MAG: amidohydrolase [Kordiimonas sp.]
MIKNTGKGLKPLWLGLCAGLFSVAASAQDFQTDINKHSDAVESEVIELRHHFHQNPELSNREFETSKKIAEFLTELGLEVQTGVAHTGVVAVLKGGKPGPVVALRSDIDALPVTETTGLPYASTKRTTYLGRDVGVMHACGHDAHISILMGAAKVLTSMREDIPGTVKFIFQPAEEGAPKGEEGGAELMIKEGVLGGEYAPEAIFGLHVWPGEAGSIIYRPRGAMAASDTFYITVDGKQTHGSSPWLGVDPVVTSAQILSAIQTIPSRQLAITAAPSVITVGTIHGGVRHNIIPEVVEMSGTIRPFDKDVRKSLLAKLEKTVKHIAKSAGAEATFELQPNTPVTYNNVELTNRMVPSLEKAAGKDMVSLNPVIMAAEDFAYYGEKIPAFFFMLGVGQDGVALEDMPSNHRPDFFVNDRALKTGVRAMATVAVDYLSSK